MRTWSAPISIDGAERRNVPWNTAGMEDLGALRGKQKPPDDAERLFQVWR
ncbi:MAG: hypothetical protein MO852_11110 [Candidatus Devosia euplotis]|nr:hypothetical protein [Candidatus Devosia euplotis]